MCTVTFIPRSDGFLLGMNRDEKWARGKRALAPTVETIDGSRAIFPKDGSGGTWIGINEYGLAFALLNRNYSGAPFPKQRSRGGIIPALIDRPSIAALNTKLRGLNLQGTLPFTLLTVSMPDQYVLQVVYDGTDYSSLPFPWHRKHWYSSGLSDQDAHAKRSPLALAATREPDRDTHDWLRRLHRQHGEAPGPFSICVHREDVGSVSYTEIEVEPGAITMRYSPGLPCTFSSLDAVSLKTS
jgi:hypothetical protein